jgi:hypothetical protein
MALYPEYNWLPWKFTVTPRGHWDNVANQRNFMDWVAKEMNFTNFTDWYQVLQKVDSVTIYNSQ